ncbi:unnamed protein product [Cochlearia groenlandica]
MESSTFLITSSSLDSRNQSSQVSRKPITKQNKKSTKTKTSSSSSTTNKHIKVRYISNPMRVKTCASKFRELVQELTGQDSVVDLQPEPVFTSPSSDHVPSPVSENIEPRGFHQEPLVGDYYEPLDDEEDVFLLPHMSAGFNGFFSNGFFNVNDFGRIDSI